MGKIIFTLIFFLMASTAIGQHRYNPEELKRFPKFYQDIIASKYDDYLNQNFFVYRQANLHMNKNEEFPILLKLMKGKMYHFLVFMDPESNKVEMKLGLEGVGHIVTDKFKPSKTGELYTEFTFVCPRNGQYLLTLFQRTSKKQPLGHIAVLERKGLSPKGEFKL